MSLLLSLLWDISTELGPDPEDMIDLLPFFSFIELLINIRKAGIQTNIIAMSAISIIISHNIDIAQK